MHAGSADSFVRNVVIDLLLLQQSWAMSLTFFYEKVQDFALGSVNGCGSTSLKKMQSEGRASLRLLVFIPHKGFLPLAH